MWVAGAELELSCCHPCLSPVIAGLDCQPTSPNSPLSAESSLRLPLPASWPLSTLAQTRRPPTYCVLHKPTGSVPCALQKRAPPSFGNKPGVAESLRCLPLLPYTPPQGLLACTRRDGQAKHACAGSEQHMPSPEVWLFPANHLAGLLVSLLSPGAHFLMLWAVYTELCRVVPVRHGAGRRGGCGCWVLVRKPMPLVIHCFYVFRMYFFFI